MRWMVRVIEGGFRRGVEGRDSTERPLPAVHPGLKTACFTLDVIW